MPFNTKTSKTSSRSTGPTQNTPKPISTTKNTLPSSPKLFVSMTKPTPVRNDQRQFKNLSYESEVDIKTGVVW